MRLEPLADPDPVGLAGGRCDRSRTTPPGGVADLDQRLAQQLGRGASTTHCGSPKPWGWSRPAPPRAAARAGPSRDTMPARVLVPLRPAPATKRTLRGYSVGVHLVDGSRLLGHGGQPTGVPPAGPCPRVVAHEAPRLPGTAPRAWSSPAYDVAAYLRDCLRLARSPRRTDAGEVVVVDDGSPDHTGAIADAYAAATTASAVVHTDNGGLGRGPQPSASSTCAATSSPSSTPTTCCRPRRTPTWWAPLQDSGSDFVTGSIVRWEGGGLRRAAVDAAAAPTRGRACARRATARDPRRRLRVEQGVPRGRSGTRAGLSWPEGVRYEDQPTTTRAFLGPAGSTCSPESSTTGGSADGSSITQQRSSLQDLADRWETKRTALALGARTTASAEVESVFLDRVLAGDLHRYFAEFPGAADEWWRLLRRGVLDLWGRRSLVHSGLPPVAPAGRLAGRAGPPRRRHRTHGVGGHARRPRAPGAGHHDRGMAAVGAGLGAGRGDRGSRSAGAAGPRGQRCVESCQRPSDPRVCAGTSLARSGPRG